MNYLNISRRCFVYTSIIGMCYTKLTNGKHVRKRVKQEEVVDDTKVFKRSKLQSPHCPRLPSCDRPRTKDGVSLTPMTMRIGRQMENHIQLNDPKYRANMRFTIQRKRRPFLLKDLGVRTAPSLMTGGSRPLVSPGDEIRVGGSVLKVIALNQERSQS